jgi:hypothetical protein
MLARGRRLPPAGIFPIARVPLVPHALYVTVVDDDVARCEVYLVADVGIVLAVFAE